MKIIETSPEISVDRMYCPSTGETIFGPGLEEVNENAVAFIAYWHDEIIDDPIIRNPKLSNAWNDFYSKWSDTGADEIGITEALVKFLKEYINDAWKVYECCINSFACGPIRSTVWYVVPADTVIEVDPDYLEDND
jgi:hypothetical protein